MPCNPYKYKGPLDPIEDSLVCIHRSETVNQLVEAIMRGDYCAVLGPRQIGKTTLLQLLKSKFTNAYYILFDFQTPHSNIERLYRWLTDRFLEEIPSTQPKINKKSLKDYDPPHLFINLLKNFKPQEDKRIIFILDEIVKLPSLETLLGNWRDIYSERLDNKNLKRYNLILTGSVDLVALPLGANSPFNITEVFYLKDFTDKESEKLIEEPFNHLNIRIEKKAKEKLLSQISGHPQILQHTCYLLVEKSKTSNMPITDRDVEEAINSLFVKNSNLKTLKKNIEENKKLRDLLYDIFKGEKIKFHPFSDFSLLGAGAIKEVDSFCEIRNEVYRKFMTDILESSEEKLGEKAAESQISSSAESYEETLPTKWQTPMIISAVLSIIIGFISYLTKNAAGLWAAGILALTVLILFIIKK